MKAFVQTDSGGRVISVTHAREYAYDMDEVELPDGFEEERLGDWVYSGGEWTNDGSQTEFENSARLHAQYKITQANQLHSVLLSLAMENVASMSFDSETEISGVGTLLPDWVPEGHSYAQGDSFQWGERVWRVSQAHVSQGIYPPDSSEALYYEIRIADDGVIVWRQAHGQYDAVREGELRHYPDENGPVYRSKIDYNAYSPDDYPQGWEMVEQ